MQVLLQTRTYLYSNMMIKLTSHGTVSYIGTLVHDCTRVYMYARGYTCMRVGGTHYVMFIIGEELSLVMF